MANVDGLSWEWEASGTTRARVRDHFKLFHDPKTDNLKINIANAEKHVDVLLPLVSKLVDEGTQEVGMCSIPSLEVQCLVSFWDSLVGQPFWGKKTLSTECITVDRIAPASEVMLPAYRVKMVHHVPSFLMYTIFNLNKRYPTFPNCFVNPVCNIW